MTKKTTIVLFYCGVAAICAAILVVVNFLIVPRMKAQADNTAAFQFKGQQTEEKWFPIERDLTGTIQTGAAAKLSDLRGKVWVIAEFFAVCPHCALRNGTELRALHEEFGDHPEFHIVCVSVDPEADDQEKLKDYAGALGADADGWWFFNAGDENTTHAYLENTLKFFGIRERTDPADIEANGRFQHDMGLILVDRDFNVIGKWPLADARSEDGRKFNPGLYEELKTEMMGRIRTELEKNESPGI